MKLYIDLLRKNHTKIHAFGLGFIQIKFGDLNRAHFYVPEVNKTGGDTEAHNHRYNFNSTIIKGSLTNKIYQFKASPQLGEFLMSEEACSKDRTKSTKDPVRGHLTLLATHDMSSGSSYSMNADVLHMIHTDRAITYLERPTGPYKDFAHVVHHESQDLVCPFSVNLPESQLWEIVERELRDAY